MVLITAIKRKAEERREKAAAIKLFRLTCKEFISRIQAGELRVPVQTLRVWKVVPMVPPIPIFFRTRKVYSTSFTKGNPCLLSEDGRLVRAPWRFVPVWSVVSFKEFSEWDFSWAIANFRGIMYDARHPNIRDKPRKKFFSRR